MPPAKSGSQPQRLFLLDGTALAFRSHYAMQRSGLTAPDGRPTGATYGFAATLKRLFDEENPELVAVAFDAKGKTFRHERYDEYKATRDRAPEELTDQMPLIRELVLAHGLPIFEVPGYEADDVIGTLARQGEAAGLDVLIVTGDKDLMQLVGERIKLYNVFKQGQTEPVIQDVEAVREKFGADPEHVIDVLAIMGDSSDNVPGVKGIGEKGATKLISQFHSVPELLERIDEVKGKTKEKLEADRDNLLLSLELVTIDTEVPLDPGFEAIEAPELDVPRLRQLYTDLDFRSLAASIEGPATSAGERDVRVVKSPDEIAEMEADLRKSGGYAAFPLTVGGSPMMAKLVGIGFSARKGRGYYVSFVNEAPEQDDTFAFEAEMEDGERDALLEALRPLLTDVTLLRVGHAAKADALVLARHGVDVPPASFDTELASFCVAGSSRRHSLDSLALAYFNVQLRTQADLCGTGAKAIGLDRVPIADAADFASEYAEVCWRLRPALKEDLELREATELYRGLELPLAPVLGRMEARGIRVDTELLASLSAEFEGEMNEHANAVQDAAGREFNVNSTKVLGQILFEELRIQDDAGVKRPKKTKTGWATDHETLSTKYGDVPIVRELLAYREIAKLKSTYLDALPRYVHPDTGRVHCSFSQVSAATGRLASSDPNLQNIPVRTKRGRSLRRAFVPREPDDAGEWALLAADYSQIELRVMAHLSGDPGLAEAFAAGHDIHAATAARIFGVEPDEVDRGMRSQAKVINFGLLYGMGPQRVARETGMGLDEAREFIDRYFSAFPTVRDWRDATIEHAKKKGYVETLLGRRRLIPDINSANSRVAAMAQNAAVNTPVQGSAADIIKRAMIDVDTALERSPLACRMLLQVHDELVFEVPVGELDETTELVRGCMEDAVELDVPLKVDFGSGASWLEAH